MQLDFSYLSKSDTNCTESGHTGTLEARDCIKLVISLSVKIQALALSMLCLK